MEQGGESIPDTGHSIVRVRIRKRTWLFQGMTGILCGQSMGVLEGVGEWQELRPGR